MRRAMKEMGERWDWDVWGLVFGMQCADCRGRHFPPFPQNARALFVVFTKWIYYHCALSIHNHNSCTPQMYSQNGLMPLDKFEKIKFLRTFRNLPFLARISAIQVLPIQKFLPLKVIGDNFRYVWLHLSI
jgi:hypothetical protein